MRAVDRTGDVEHFALVGLLQPLRRLAMQFMPRLVALKLTGTRRVAAMPPQLSCT